MNRVAMIALAVIVSYFLIRAAHSAEIVTGPDALEVALDLIHGPCTDRVVERQVPPVGVLIIKRGEPLMALLSPAQYREFLPAAMKENLRCMGKAL